MKSKIGLIFLLFAILVSASAFGATPEKVVVFVLENTGSKKARVQPYLKEILGKGVYLKDYRAVDHPSQPNYIGMVAGSPLQVTDDDNHNLKEKFLGDLLEEKGKTWKIYADGFPGKCYLGKKQGAYVRKHNPFISFVSVQTNSKRCSNIVNSSSFEGDFKAKKLPHFSMFIPDLNNDGHDTGVTYADAWLKNTLNPLLSNVEAMKGVMIIVTFDEDEHDEDNVIYTVLLGPDVKTGVEISERYDHYSLLKTIETIFGLKDLGRGDASAKVFSGYLK